jgi:hypothetical protein
MEPIMRNTVSAHLFTMVVAASLMTGCFFESDGTVVYDPGPPVVVPGPAPAPVIVVGDLSLQYDFGGWSCFDVGVTDIEFEVVDEFGYLVASDWGIPCHTGGNILLRALPLGTYYVTLGALDGWGSLAFQFDGAIYHDQPFSAVVVGLY